MARSSSSKKSHRSDSDSDSEDEVRDELPFLREERTAKKWTNKDKYHLSNGVLEPCVHMPRAKAIVRMVPAWRERKVVSGAAGRATPVRLVQVWADKGLAFMPVRRLDLVQVVVGIC
jgi:hypothetical protein